MLLDVVCEDGQDGVVVLEEGARGVCEVMISDVFVRGGLGVCLTCLDVDAKLAVIADGVRGQIVRGRGGVIARSIDGMAPGVFSQQDRRASLVLAKLFLHPLSLALHAQPDDVGADGAVLNVHDLALALFHEANVGTALELGLRTPLVPLMRAESRRPVEVRRQLGAVAVLQRAADGVEDGRHQLCGKVGEVLKGLVDDPALAAQLLGVVEHLELAAAAGAKVLALDAGVVAQGGGLDDGDEVGDGLVLAPQMAEHLDLGNVAGHGKGHDVYLVGAGPHGEAITGGGKLQDFDFGLGSFSWQVFLRLGSFAVGGGIGFGFP